MYLDIENAIVLLSVGKKINVFRFLSENYHAKE